MQLQVDIYYGFKSDKLKWRSESSFPNFDDSNDIFPNSTGPLAPTSER